MFSSKTTFNLGGVFEVVIPPPQKALFINNFLLF
jgi:hypothetical protein